MTNQFSKNIVPFITSSLSDLKVTDQLSDFVPLSDEALGGITIYVHNEIAEEFITYLVWAKPQSNPDMDFDDVDWDGWLSRGWDLYFMTNMKENLEVNHCSDAEVFDIKLNDVLVAKTTFKEHVETYEAHFKDFLEYHANTQIVA